jgi:heme/copper-type cytochrome/quinol oxidase subunit 1
MTPPTVQGAARPEVVSERIPRRRPGWIELVTNADHKAVARMYIASSLFFAAIALTELMMMRLQLAVPDNTLIRPEIFDRLLSAYGVTALLLFALPLAIGLISHIVPLQIGARGMALPRVHHLSYWLYLFGGLTIYLSFLYRPSEAGTISLAPLSDIDFLHGHGVDAWAIGVILVLAGFVAFAVSMIATLRTSRAPGLVWRRVPLFSWAGAVVSYTLLVVAPVMIAALAMLMIDRHFDGVFFVPGDDGSPLLYEHLSSIFLAGAYISVVIAALGTISEILPTFSRQPHFGHNAIAGSFVALAVLGVLAWMQNMYSAPIPIGFLYFAMLMALSAAVPVGLIVFNWLATLSGGSITMRAPMLFALGAVVFTIAGLAGELAQSVIPVGWQIADTGVAWGDTHTALVGAGVLGGFAGLHYWFPKLSGRLMGESLARASFWTIVVGALLLIVPTQIAGLQGMPVDVFKFYGDTGMSFVNALATVGAFVFMVGFLMTLVNAASSYSRGVEVGPDPWDGTTLEWFTLSPPPVHNFDLVPDVRSAEPLADIKDAIRRRSTRWAPPPAISRERQPEPVGATSSASEESSSGAEAAQETAGEPVEDSPDEARDDNATAGLEDEDDRPVA